MAWRAVGSIALFIGVYLLLVVLAVGLTIVAGYAGILLIAFKPNLYTLLIGGGLVSMGILVIFFLLKFIFKQHTVDRAHLLEVTEEQEPALFQLIHDIVDEVQTDFPKKVYFSAQVNAAVFYDSSFWSMFLPVKKNLEIGVGLMNTVTVSELKAILAHEFGHFSQRSMKVGSYVYNVNQVIHNLLFDNEGYSNLISRWASVSGYIAFFVNLAVRIISGIQWVLRKVYEVVNLNYLALSREMEFHADEVAAHVAGSTPLITSLLRMDLADQSFQTVIDFYNRKIAESVKTDNVYPQQQFMLHFLARESKFSTDNGLPQISPEQSSRFNRSKLNIKDQWASHPSTEDRIAQLQRLNVAPPDTDQRLATVLLQHSDSWQSQLTQRMFESITYEQSPADLNAEQFAEEYTKKYRENAFDEAYNGYYDHRNPTSIDVNTLSADRADLAPARRQELFSDAVLDLVYSAQALENDLATLRQIADEQGAHIKTFDYDGQKYFRSDCASLIPKLEADLTELKSKLNVHDERIFGYYLAIARSLNQEETLLTRYRAFFENDREYDQRFEAYTQLAQATDFFQYTTPFEVIENNLAQVFKLEITFKKHIEEMLAEEKYQLEITPEVRESLNKYISQPWTYFRKPEYDQEALQVLSEAMQSYNILLARTYFRCKKTLLDHQMELERQYQMLTV
jgi:Zn-dependent protease with chaperone function